METNARSVIIPLSITTKRSGGVGLILKDTDTAKQRKIRSNGYSNARLRDVL